MVQMVFHVKPRPLKHTDGYVEVPRLLKVGEDRMVLLLDSNADLLKSLVNGDGFRCSLWQVQNISESNG